MNSWVHEDREFLGEISGSHGDEYEDGCIQGCCPTYSGRHLPTFQRQSLEVLGLTKLTPWSRSQSEIRDRKVETVVRDTTFSGGTEINTAVKVPRQCQLVLLVNIYWKGVKAFGSGESRRKRWNEVSNGAGTHSTPSEPRPTHWLNAMEALGGRGGIAPTHSQPRH
jgi:hypothetical protein